MTDLTDETRAEWRKGMRRTEALGNIDHEDAYRFFILDAEVTRLRAEVEAQASDAYTAHVATLEAEVERLRDTLAEAERQRNTWARQMADLRDDLTRDLITERARTEELCGQVSRLHAALAEAERERYAISSRLAAANDKVRGFERTRWPEEAHRLKQQRDEARAEIERLNADLDAEGKVTRQHDMDRESAERRAAKAEAELSYLNARRQQTKAEVALTKAVGEALDSQLLELQEECIAAYTRGRRDMREEAVKAIRAESLTQTWPSVVTGCERALRVVEGLGNKQHGVSDGLA